MKDICDLVREHPIGSFFIIMALISAVAQVAIAFAH